MYICTMFHTIYGLAGGEPRLGAVRTVALAPSAACAIRRWRTLEDQVRENHGENHGKHMGKYGENMGNYGKLWENMVKLW